MSNKIKRITTALKWNIRTGMWQLFHRRDDSCVLIGAWMGTKFADNSRYLFQYLNSNKEKLGLKHVVWVTRDNDVNTLLNGMGYECYMIGTRQSDYYHLKSGIHIICNAANDIPGFPSDIDCKYSFGAKKIQLWHGVGGIKAVGASSNQAKSLPHKQSIIKRIAHTRLFNSCFSLGGWAEAKVLATGHESAKANIAYIGCRPDRIFISGYPRNCECIEYLQSELEVINKISQYSGAILYLPTFRSDISHYRHPLENPEVREYIHNNNILWIEKPHTADHFFDHTHINNKDFCALEATFDINAIYRNVSCIITDYSSVAFDAVYYAKPLIMYTPDIEEFRNGDVGFLIDYEKMFKSMICMDFKDFQKMITTVFDDKEKYVEKRIKDYRRINEYAFENKVKTYDDIWNDITHSL